MRVRACDVCAGCTRECARGMATAAVGLRALLRYETLAREGARDGSEREQSGERWARQATCAETEGRPPSAVTSHGQSVAVPEHRVRRVVTSF